MLLFSEFLKAIGMHSLKQTHLRVFVAVAELGSISAAAQRLHRSPSAVSMTVANLEAQLDRALFEAGGKSRLTPFGSYVFEAAREQLERFDRAVAGIQAYSRNDFGRVVIAAVPSFATRYLPALLADFVARHPKVTLAIRDDSSARINTMIERGNIDVGIASPSDDAQGVRCQPLLADPLGVVCSRSHPLAQLNRPLVWGDLRGQRFIANGTCVLIRAPELQALLAAAEIDVRNTTSLLALVAAGVGVTTLPRLAVPAERRDVAFLPTGYRDLERTIGIITPTDRTLAPAASAFVATVMESLAE